MTVYISRDDSAALAHHGIMGMKWGVRHEKERANKPKKIKTTAAPSVKTKRVGRIRNGGRISEVGGRQYKQSFATSRAHRKAQKWIMRSAERPSSKAVIQAQKWQNKEIYEHRRDMGKSRGTRIARSIGNTMKYGGAAAAAASLVTLGSAAAGAALIAGGVAVAGAITNTKAKRRQYKQGYRLETGKRIAVPERTKSVYKNNA